MSIEHNEFVQSGIALEEIERLEDLEVEGDHKEN